MQAFNLETKTSKCLTCLNDFTKYGLNLKGVHPKIIQEELERCLQGTENEILKLEEVIKIRRRFKIGSKQKKHLYFETFKKLDDLRIILSRLTRQKNYFFHQTDCPFCKTE